MARCDNPKKYSSGQPSALGRSSPKSHSSLRNCALKRCSGQAASSFGSIPCEKPLQPLEMYPEKIFPPDSLRLWVDTLRKVPPAFGNVLRKNVETRQPSAFGQSPAKSLSSVRRCTSKKCSCRTAFGCLSTPTARLPQAARCDDPKKYSSRRLSTFGQSFSENLSGLRRCTPKKYSDQTAFDFGLIPCEKPRQPSKIYPEKTFTSDCLRLLVNPLQKVPPAPGDITRKNVQAR